MLLTLIAIAAFFATLAGGMFALTLKDKLHLVLGFSAGAVIGVAFFDLLPEAIHLGESYHSAEALLAYAGWGFLLYLVLDRVRLLRSRHGEEALHQHAAHDHAEPHHELHDALPTHGDAHGHSHTHDHTHGHNQGHTHGHAHREAHSHERLGQMRRVLLGAGSFSMHSFLDGIAVGLAFQASAAAGLVVAIAVLTHDFSDGINTMSVVLRNKGDRKLAMRWLFADALAPALGIAVAQLFSLPLDVLAVVLAVFAGFFLYIGASDLIPESFHAHPKFLTTAMTLLGAAVLYLAVTFAPH